MKKIICFFFLAFSFNGFACKNDTREVERLIKSPDKAHRLYLGKTRLKDGMLFFDAYWPSTMSSVSVYDPCTPFSLKENSNYVFLDLRKLPDNKKEKAIKYTSGVFIELRKEVPKVLDTLVNKLTVDGKRTALFMSYCQEDKNCMLVKNNCGEHVGINTKYQKEYSEYLSKNVMIEKCDPKLKPQNISRCIENFCK